MTNLTLTLICRILENKRQISHCGKSYTGIMSIKDHLDLSLLHFSIVVFFRARTRAVESRSTGEQNLEQVPPGGDVEEEVKKRETETEAASEFGS